VLRLLCFYGLYASGTSGAIMWGGFDFGFGFFGAASSPGLGSQTAAVKNPVVRGVSSQAVPFQWPTKACSSYHLEPQGAVPRSQVGTRYELATVLLR
jgi:hypothetical protein